MDSRDFYRRQCTVMYMMMMLMMMMLMMIMMRSYRSLLLLVEGELALPGWFEVLTETLDLSLVHVELGQSNSTSHTHTETHTHTDTHTQREAERHADICDVLCCCCWLTHNVVNVVDKTTMSFSLRKSRNLSQMCWYDDIIICINYW